MQDYVVSDSRIIDERLIETDVVRSGHLVLETLSLHLHGGPEVKQ